MIDIKTLDPRGLFKDSYEIDGITEGECRSIFLDWAIMLPAGQDARPWVEEIYALYAPQHPDHPMTSVLHQGMAEARQTGRRGGRAARVKADRAD
ncbi:hypothetical protein [Aliiroseovarius sp. YM-037]|uniref:hypothetical protein n=1 Tax=Aliiroseovarius sp. YM-037 TaxID=3341728 RepID=UPI003A807F8F